MISLDAVVEAADRTGMKAFHKGNIGEMRRNLVLTGISAKALNDAVGHEVKIGDRCRVFVHRRNVPCRYREAACKRPGLMNNLWDASGVCCEILSPLGEEDTEDGGGANRKATTAAAADEIRIGDSVTVLPNTHQPKKIDVGIKPHGFFVRPKDRTSEDVREAVMPPYLAAIACLWDPEGFQRVEEGYNSVGARFWSTEAYSVGLRLRCLRIPLLLLVAIFVALLSIGMAVGLRVPE